MSVIHKEARVPYSAAQMYALVNDIARYQEFVPWCTKSVIDVQTDDVISATLTFAAKGIQQSFSTRNRLVPNIEMKMELINGPFKYLNGCWRFENHEKNTCTVTLDLSFELASKMLAILFGPVFQQVATNLVDAFVKRASEIYD